MENCLYRWHVKFTIPVIFKWAIPVVLGKGKAIPLESEIGPEGSRRLRLPDFKTIGT